MGLIELKDIRKIYAKSDVQTIALDGSNLQIDKGESVAIMGPSGSGKSTLLNIVGCLDIPTSGEYILNGQSIDKLKGQELATLRNASFGFVLQYFGLIDEYTVYENVEIPLSYSKKTGINKKKLIKETLDMLGIADKIKKTPSQLSGGQNQRVAIARALINDPEIILADEPTGALDKKTGQEVMNILKDLNKKGKTLIIVTHDDNIASQCSRTVNICDGKIVTTVN